MPARPRIPVNLLTGFLGVGKSTAIRHLLKMAPANARWAVVVNEFGQVAVDAAALEADPTRMTIRELPGGCLCCTLGAPLRVTINRLIREVRPDRLLIEPSGVGHPARVLDTLREQGLGDVLTVGATLCLVDARQLKDTRVTSHPVFIDQVELADVLIASKADLAAPDELAAFQRWAGALYPPKAVIAQCAHGQLDPAWLDRPAVTERRARFPDLHRQSDHVHGASHHHNHHDQVHGSHDHADYHAASHSPTPGRPVRLVDTGQGREACGWLFSQDDAFDRSKLLHFLTALIGPDRIKGVFRTGRDWLLIDRVNDETSQRATGWRTDSRVEMLAVAGEAPDWDLVQSGLIACLRA